MAIHQAEAVRYLSRRAAVEGGHREEEVAGSVDSAAEAAALAAEARAQVGSNAKQRVPQQA